MSPAKKRSLQREAHLLNRALDEFKQGGLGRGVKHGADSFNFLNSSVIWKAL